MKTCLGIVNVVLASSWSLLLLGCEAPGPTTAREANVLCATVPTSPSTDQRELPVRFEAEELRAQVSSKGHERTDKDAQASKKRVSEVRFEGRSGSVAYWFKSLDNVDASVWLRVRQGPDQAIFEAWVDDAVDGKVTIDGYAHEQRFIEVMIGTVGAIASHHRTTHEIDLAVAGKNQHSSSRGITIDYVELRAPAPPPTDPNPCAQQPDGTACDDGNKCTQDDQCHAGTCAGSPVVCAALDACHLAGVCDPETGACTSPNQPDGTACSDNSQCTRQDTCLAGVCTGSDPVVCPTDPNCQVQGTCDPGSGLCSEPSQCAYCGNGVVDPSLAEECDWGDTISGDGCSDTCKNEYCGDGIVQPTIQDLSFYYLGRACNIGPTPLIIRINGVEVMNQNLPESCDCQPGIQSVRVTDPTLRAAAVTGSNTVELATNGELAWVVAYIFTREAGLGMPLWDYAGNNDVGTMNPDLCASQALASFGASTSMALSGGETCDDGNNIDGDGCGASCQVEASP